MTSPIPAFPPVMTATPSVPRVAYGASRLVRFNSSRTLRAVDFLSRFTLGGFGGGDFALPGVVATVAEEAAPAAVVDVVVIGEEKDDPMTNEADNVIAVRKMAALLFGDVDVCNKLLLFFIRILLFETVSTTELIEIRLAQ